MYRGVLIMLTGIVFNVIESLWFGRNTNLGFNWLPQSRAELICDAISTMLLILGFVVQQLDITTISKNIKKNDNTCPHGYLWDDCPDCRH